MTGCEWPGLAWMVLLGAAGVQASILIAACRPPWFHCSRHWLALAPTLAPHQAAQQDSAMCGHVGWPSELDPKWGLELASVREIMTASDLVLLEC